MELLFRRLLLEDLGNDTAELAADALLPLILAHSDAFQSFGAAPPCCASVSCVRCHNLWELLSTPGDDVTCRLCGSDLDEA